MSLTSRINEDMKAALRAGDKPRLGVVRLIMAAVKQREIDERIVLDDTQVLGVLDKMLKQRRDSISQYQAAGRQELVDQEVYEVGILQNYLPAELSEAEINSLIDTAIMASGAVNAKDMGKVIGILKPKVQGRADMAQVSITVKNKLAS